jgi:hypothetical protein
MPRFFIALTMVLLLSACATQPQVEVAPYPGFLRGLLHGIIAPFAFVGSLFSDGIAIYAFPNAGGWYDFGFLLGMSVWGGGGHAAGRRRR